MALDFHSSDWGIEVARMVRICRMLTLASISFLLFSCRPTHYTDEEKLVLASAAILIVEVDDVSSERAMSDPWGGFHLAALNVREIVAEDPKFQVQELGELQLPFRQHMSHWVDFQVGKIYLVYLSFCWNGPVLVDPEIGATLQDSVNVVKLPLGRGRSYHR